MHVSHEEHEAMETLLNETLPHLLETCLRSKWVGAVPHRRPEYRGCERIEPECTFDEAIDRGEPWGTTLRLTFQIRDWDREEMEEHTFDLGPFPKLSQRWTINLDGVEWLPRVVANQTMASVIETALSPVLQAAGVNLKFWLPRRRTPNQHPSPRVFALLQKYFTDVTMHWPVEHKGRVQVALLNCIENDLWLDRPTHPQHPVVWAARESGLRLNGLTPWEYCKDWIPASVPGASHLEDSDVGAILHRLRRCDPVTAGDRLPAPYDRLFAELSAAMGHDGAAAHRFVSGSGSVGAMVRIAQDAAQVPPGTALLRDDVAGRFRSPRRLPFHAKLPASARQAVPGDGKFFVEGSPILEGYIFRAPFDGVVSDVRIVAPAGRKDIEVRFDFLCNIPLLVGDRVSTPLGETPQQWAVAAIVPAADLPDGVEMMVHGQDAPSKEFVGCTHMGRLAPRDELFGGAGFHPLSFFGTPQVRLRWPWPGNDEGNFAPKKRNAQELWRERQVVQLEERSLRRLATHLPRTFEDLSRLQRDDLALRDHVFDQVTRAGSASLDDTSETAWSVPHPPNVRERLEALFYGLGFGLALTARDVRLHQLDDDGLLAKSSGRVHEPDAIVAPEIFGPQQDYVCKCGDRRRYRERGTTCARCGVPIVHSLEQYRRCGHIVLPAPVQASGRDITVVPVLPIQMRGPDGGRWSHGLNERYRTLLQRLARLNRHVDMNSPDILVEPERNNVKEAVRDVMSEHMKLLGMYLKHRRGDLGYAGVVELPVARDAALSTGQCQLPVGIALRLYRPFVEHLLREKHRSQSRDARRAALEPDADGQYEPEVVALVEQIIRHQRVVVMGVHRNDPLLAVLQPTMGANDAIRCAVDDSFIKSPAVRIYSPLSEEARKELGTVSLGPVDPTPSLAVSRRVKCFAMMGRSLRDTEMWMGNPMLWEGPMEDHARASSREHSNQAAIAEVMFGQSFRRE